MASRRCKVLYYKDSEGFYRWRFVARNGKIMADSAEGYRRLIDCEFAFSQVRMDDADIERVD